MKEWFVLKEREWFSVINKSSLVYILCPVVNLNCVTGIESYSVIQYIFGFEGTLTLK